MNAPPLSLARFITAAFERMTRAGMFGRRRLELRRGLMQEMNARYVPHASAKLELTLALAAGTAALT